MLQESLSIPFLYWSPYSLWCKHMLNWYQSSIFGSNTQWNHWKKLVNEDLFKDLAKLLDKETNLIQNLKKSNTNLKFSKENYNKIFVICFGAKLVLCILWNVFHYLTLCALRSTKFTMKNWPAVWQSLLANTDIITYHSIKQTYNKQKKRLFDTPISRLRLLRCTQSITEGLIFSKSNFNDP